jgi:hypothetical protein
LKKRYRRRDTFDAGGELGRERKFIALDAAQGASKSGFKDKRNGKKENFSW